MNEGSYVNPLKGSSKIIIYFSARRDIQRFHFRWLKIKEIYIAGPISLTLNFHHLSIMKLFSDLLFWIEPGFVLFIEFVTGELVNALSINLPSVGFS